MLRERVYPTMPTFGEYTATRLTRSKRRRYRQKNALFTRLANCSTVKSVFYLPTRNFQFFIPMTQERTRYQEKIIKNYYRNLDAIATQKAMEQITELYLAEGKKRETVWKRLIGHLEKMGMPQNQIDHLRERDDPALVAEALKKFA